MAAIVGVLALLNPFESSPEPEADPPWFYNVTSDDIARIDIATRSSSESFVKIGPGQWHFRDPEGVPVDNQRWSGVPLLLSGPQSQRILFESVDDPDRFGLSQPTADIKVHLENGEILRVIMGDETPDAAAHYVQMEGFPQLFLIDSSWGRVLIRIADESPIPNWYLASKESSVFTGVDVRVGGEETKFRKNEEGWQFEDGSALSQVRWDEVLPLLNGPPVFQVVEERVQDPRPYGISEESDSVSIRFKAETERGVEYNDQATFLVGDDSSEPDGKYVYVDGQGLVLLFDPNWVRVMTQLGADPPYAQSF